MSAFLEALAKHCAERPDAIAIDEGTWRSGQDPRRNRNNQAAQIQRRWTWRELNAAVIEEASRLRSLPDTDAGLVVCDLPRGAELVIRWLAAHRVGAAILAIDPASPWTYRSAQVERARRSLGVFCKSRGVPPAAIAWIVFTSGSTGRPKGVCVGHGGVEALLCEQVGAFRVTSADRVAWVLSPGFDASFSDVGVALQAGATLVPFLGTASDLSSLVQYVHDAHITVADLPPSLLAHVDPQAFPSCLRTIVIGGEPCPPHALFVHARARRIVNVYGPTEATVCTSVEVVDARAELSFAPSLGTPFNHVSYRLEMGANVAQRNGERGESGELLIGGEAVAFGYLDDEVLTEQRFFVNEGLRWFRSGDLVRRRKDGTWDFVGRVDRQLKVRGKLVAPEEVETFLRTISGVSSALVRLERDHLVADVSGDVTDEYLYSACLQLPTHLRPASFVRGVVTTSARGKSVRKGREGTDTVAAIVSAVLQRPVHEGECFELDSLHRTELLVALEAELGKRLPMDALASEAPSGLTLDAIQALLDASVRDEGLRPRELISAFPKPTATRKGPSARADGPIVITGAAGFLGSRLVHRLVREGERVRAVVRNEGSAERLQILSRGALRENSMGRDIGAQPLQAGRPTPAARPPQAGRPTPELVIADLRSEADLEAAVSGASVVVHLAASLRMDANCTETFSTNVAPLRTLFTSGAPLVMASSLAVFAYSQAMENAGPPVDGTAPLLDVPIFGGYAQSKALAELWCAGENVHILRIGLVVDDAEEDTDGGPEGVVPGLCPLRSLAKALSVVGLRPLGGEERAFDATPASLVIEALVESVWSARKLWDPTSRSRAGHGASTISAVHCGPATLGDLYAALDEARVARGHGELTVVDPTTFREAVLTSPLLPFERRAALGLLAENRRVGSDLFRLTHRTFRNPTAGDVSPREALRGMVRGLIRSAGACP